MTVKRDIPARVAIICDRCSAEHEFEAADEGKLKFDAGWSVLTVRSGPADGGAFQGLEICGACTNAFVSWLGARLKAAAAAEAGQ